MKSRKRRIGFSAAPWRVLDQGDGYIIVDADYRHVAQVRGNPLGLDKANAELMEQAPKMLGILRRMVAYDCKGDVLGIIPYDRCMEEILEVLRGIDGR